jgi:hypothetical protein
MTASGAVGGDDGAEHRAAARMSAAGAALGVAVTIVGLFLSWVVPVISGIVLLGYGLILGAIFGALFGVILYRARVEDSPEVADLQRAVTRE